MNFIEHHKSFYDLNIENYVLTTESLKSLVKQSLTTVKRFVTNKESRNREQHRKYMSYQGFIEDLLEDVKDVDDDPSELDKVIKKISIILRSHNLDMKDVADDMQNPEIPASMKRSLKMYYSQQTIFKNNLKSLYEYALERKEVLTKDKIDEERKEKGKKTPKDRKRNPVK